MRLENPESPTHWRYPEQLRDWYASGEACTLIDGAYEEIETALIGINGVMLPGYDGWGVSFDTESDKVLFFLKFDWSKFA